MHTIKEFITHEIPLVDKNETLYHAYKLMEKYGLDKIVIYDKIVEDGKRIVKKPVGVLTSRDIVFKLATERIRRLSTGRLHVSSFMSINPTCIGLNDDIRNAIKIMVEKGFGIIPVVENESIVGGLYRESLLRLCEKEETEVRHIMDTNPVVAKTTDRILKIRTEMLNNDISFMPVVDEEDKLVGYITIADVAFAIFKFQDIVPEKYRKERIMHLIVEDVMRLRPPTLKFTDTIATAASKIIEKNSKGVVIVDETNRIAGIVTSHDIIRFIYEKYFKE